MGEKRKVLGGLQMQDHSKKGKIGKNRNLNYW